MSMPRRGRLAALAALTVVSVGAGVLAVPASAAPGVHAAARAEAGGTTSAAAPILVTGRSSWGFKDSWVRYVTGMGGSVNVAGGASADAAGRIDYPVKHGSVDPAGRSADVRFGGSVTYAVPSHGITAITLANPRVVLKDGKGTLHMDVTTDIAVGQAPVTTPGVPLAALTASADALDGAVLDWTGITAALTEEGSAIFAYQGRPMYPAGTALDPVAISGGVSVPTLTVSQVSELGAENEVTVSGKGYQPGRGVYLAQSIALPGTTYPSVFGNAAYIRQVGADGTFSVTLKLTETFTPSGAPVVDCRTTACFVTSFNSHDGGDPTWMPSRAQDVAQPLRFGVEVPAATVTQHPASRTVRSGATGTFTAAATGADSVRWERSTDRGTTWSTVPGATTATLSVKAAAALDGHRYRAVFVNASGETATSAATLTVSAVPTRIVSFNASPEPVGKGSKLKVVATLQTASATDNVWRPLAKTPVVIEFRSKGGKTWSRATTVTTDSKGVVSASVTAVKDGTWRARYAGTADRAAAVSSSDNVDVKLRTAVSGFNASPEPVRKGRTITVKGTLRSLDGTWKNASGQSVIILFKADGSSKWSKLATVRTNGKGVFSKGFTAKKDGTWKAQFKATSSRLGTIGSGDRVDVR
ncbi:HtaA domain-containing protein [Streptomyces anulatus]|uniref:HtaA domain-containing protein n=1 Tax=Streptomyces TaxID=1883 RepID=UPI0006F862AF|nr:MULTISPECIES: HtaA domain-containing protein [Streptomyces]KQX27605.1 Htaa domain protein [Streptomyces sp. Root1295]KRA34845.1 Htaa domain protein [Streptomyces sp. Root63]WSC59337.1 HtaA domain-containing protein [Streptomyces anulatus]WTC68836.1 HtaA domain-containing protein [Streptomyces anulatus]